MSRSVFLCKNSVGTGLTASGQGEVSALPPAGHGLKKPPTFLNMKAHLVGILIAASAACALPAAGQSPYVSSADFAKYAAKLRESAILKMEPKVVIPTASRTLGVAGKYPWKTNIVTTIFWIGEPAGGNNPVHNVSSSWDLNWETSYGGYDNPNPGARSGYRPASFIPRQNPFYVALPYNDVTHGSTKPEARQFIPWFRDAFVEEGKSVCRDRWLAIRNTVNGKICYAQWSDCGPFRTDHYNYVFGPERPKPNLNGGAGLDISPAVRDYLGLGSNDVTDWKFVDAREVPNGPWGQWGENNDFVKNARRMGTNVVSAAPPAARGPAREPALPVKDEAGPVVIVK